MIRTFRDDLEQSLCHPEFARMFGAAQAKSSFAITLAKARKELNLTQKQLADRLGVSQSYVAKLEGGEANPTLERIGSLLAVLGISLTTGTAPLSPYPNTPAVEAERGSITRQYRGQKNAAERRSTDRSHDVMVVQERPTKGR